MTETKTTNRLKAAYTAVKLFVSTSDLFKNFWKFFSFLLAGILLGLKFKKAPSVINAETYNNEPSTSIGKVKQKGEGNNQEVNQKQQLSRKEIRQKRKADRKKRKDNKQ